MPQTRFGGWTVLLTGASAGLGTEFARQLAFRLGAGRLILTARREDRLKTLAEELRQTFPALQVDVEVADLSKAEETQSLIELLRQRGHAPDLLINNAGLGDMGLFENSEWSRTEAMLEVNIDALTRLTHAFVPAMIARGRGAILNVGSIAGYLPLPTFAVYAGTKAYVNSFSEALHWELRGTGVTVMALCPGPVPTEFGEVARRKDAKRAMDSPAMVQISTEEAVKQALHGLEKGAPRVVPGGWMKFSAAWLGKIPFFLLRLIYRGTVGAAQAQRKAVAKP